MKRLAFALAASASLGACADDVPTIELDPVVDAEECIRPIADPILPEAFAVYEVLADEDTDGAWAIAAADLADGFGTQIVVARIPGEGEDPVDPVPLGFEPNVWPEMSLVPNPDPEAVYVVRMGEAHGSLRRVVAGVGVVDANTGLRGFPTPGPGEDADDWMRQVLLIDGEPVIVAVPRESADLSMTVFVAHFTDKLDLFDAWGLQFGSSCDDSPDPESCAAENLLRICNITTARPAPRTDVSILTLAFEESICFNPPEGGESVEEGSVGIVRLSFGPDGPQALLHRVGGLTFPQFGPVILSPFEIAFDPFAIYFYARDLGDAAGGRFSMRLDPSRDELFVLTSSTPRPGDQVRLVQLENQAALVGLDAGRILASPLVDPQDWADREFPEVALLDEPDLVDFEPAGPGHLLLTRAEGDRSLWRIECLGSD